MGCDIHGWVEKKIGDKYVAIKELVDSSRNYIGHENTPEPKGVPDDVSDTCQYYIDKWDCDGHSHSYMPLDQAFVIFKSTGDMKYSYNYFGVDEEEMEGCRLVFWFDN